MIRFTRLAIIACSRMGSFFMVSGLVSSHVNACMCDCIKAPKLTRPFFHLDILGPLFLREMPICCLPPGPLQQENARLESLGSSSSFL
jgi:hypothetical protein